MIVLDTSFLVDALTDTGNSHVAMRASLDRGERLLLPSLTLYEWLRGPRSVDQLEMQQALFPASGAIPFTSEEAAVAARLYATVTRPRGREMDLAIAASAITRDAALWTLNANDFSDLPGLTLVGAG